MVTRAFEHDDSRQWQNLPWQGFVYIIHSSSGRKIRITLELMVEWEVIDFQVGPHVFFSLYYSSETGKSRNSVELRFSKYRVDISQFTGSFENGLCTHTPLDLISLRKKKHISAYKNKNVAFQTQWQTEVPQNYVPGRCGCSFIIKMVWLIFLFRTQVTGSVL